MDDSFDCHVFTNCLNNKDYISAINYCQAAIEAAPDDSLSYIYLGLAFLLSGDELSAESAWLAPVVEFEPDEVAEYNQHLIDILTIRANVENQFENWNLAWKIHFYIQEFEPNSINNLLELCKLAVKLDIFDWDAPPYSSLNGLIKELPEVDINFDLLQDVITTLSQDIPELNPTYVLMKHSSKYSDKLPKFYSNLQFAVQKLGVGSVLYYLAVNYAELGHNLWPEDAFFLDSLASYHMRVRNYDQALDAAQKLISVVDNLPHKIHGYYRIIEILNSAGCYEEEVRKNLDYQNTLLLQLLESNAFELTRSQTCSLFILPFTAAYVIDNPRDEKKKYNQLMSLCQANIEYYSYKHVENYQTQIKTRNLASRVNLDRPLKIGFLSNHLRRHAIGWLAWAIFQYRDPNKTQLYSYYVGNILKITDNWQQWYMQKSDHVFCGELDSYKLADKINADEIDILVDLDSVTFNVNCEVLALKSAPIQLSWLGFDASGLPAVDYYLADPYVLPHNAQNYYTEKIWRFPETYVAVDGFVVTNPSLRPESLDLNSDAVIFLTSQRGSKRNRHMTELQMQIIKNVPDSYLLIKGVGDGKRLQNWFLDIAESIGLTPERLRFLPMYPTDEEHRANLAIADVVLDTYPYNGATTTLETLWMEIPLVTRVGEQFVARNSYAFLVNAGVSEGVAWTDQEYVEWGIRLGTDVDLRRQVSWKLKRAKKFAPLWNAPKFAKEMESAFLAMWHHYVTGEMILPPGHRVG